MNKFLLAAMLGSTLLAGPGFAQAPAAPAAHAAGPDRSGVLTRAEAMTQAESQFARLDTNHDGQISRDEIHTLRQALAGLGGGMHRMGGPGGEHRHRAPRPGEAPAGAKHDGKGKGGKGGGFERIDTNGDGAISRAEYVANEMKRFDMVDTNHDGRIDKAEREASRGRHPAPGAHKGPADKPHPAAADAGK